MPSGCTDAEQHPVPVLQVMNLTLAGRAVTMKGKSRGIRSKTADASLHAHRLRHGHFHVKTSAAISKASSAVLLHIVRILSERWKPNAV
jgi:hypothetical protein